MDQQTVILCYELSDQEALTLHQAKAHVRALTASKAFQSGVSLEQILPACYWKLHNSSVEVCGLCWFRPVSLGPSSVCSADPLITHILRFGKKKKTKQKKSLSCTFLCEVFSWDWTHPSLPLPQSRSVKEGGGGQRRYIPSNRALVADHRPTGSLTPNQHKPLGKFCCLFTS